MPTLPPSEPVAKLNNINAKLLNSKILKFIQPTLRILLFLDTSIYTDVRFTLR